MLSRDKNPGKNSADSSATPVQTGLFRSRPFTDPTVSDEVSPHKQELPDLQTQLERGARFNQSLSRMKVHANKPLIQPKIAVGAPGDKYEQEADRMAQQVMSMPAAVTHPPIQRLEKQEQEEKEPVQTKPLAASITPLVQRETAPEELEEEQEPVQMKRSLQETAEVSIQRDGTDALPAMPEEEEKVQTKPSLQRAAEAGGHDASSNLESRLSSSKGGGSPLPDQVRSFMEPRFGADFSQVRVHTDGEAVQMNQELGAQAFTHGSDIYYGAGKSPSVSDLTAHELTHVVQQTGRIQAKPASSIDVGYGSLLGAGDEAEAKAAKSPLTIDAVSVTADMGRVDEIIGEIDKNQHIVLEAEKDNTNLIEKYQASVTNATTKANLQIFKDKLGVTNVDTSSFAVQFRTAYADYQRLLAEGSEYLTAIGVDTNNPIDTLTSGFEAMGKDSLKIDEAQVGLQRFRAARTNLNTAAVKMDGEMKSFRGAAQSLQGGLDGVKAKAASKQGADASSKLKAVRDEIEAVSKGVGMCIKVASAVSGFAGEGGAVGKTIGDANAAGESASKMAVAKSFYKDADAMSAGTLGKVDLGGISLGTIAGGDPAAIAEGLVKIIGEQVNKDKIVSLQQNIASAAAEEKTFNAAAAASTFSGLQSNMEAAAAKLSTLVATYQEAKAEMAAAGEALMAQLAKGGGKKGKDQSKAVLFLTDADRFLAQATNAITNGMNQQSNAKDAANDRKKLRGTTHTIEAEPDRQIQKYWKATKTKVPGKLWGTNDSFHLQSVDVTFTGSGSGFDYNDIVQGGKGTVEGTGGAEDGVAKKLETLTKAKTQIQELQKKVQAALGLGGPGLNA